MSKEKRSKGACWTCSFRRKKCDEALPICSVCVSLSVPCFGYEPNPSWADGGEKQKAKSEELRVMIRESATLRRRQARQKQQMAASNPKCNRQKDTKDNLQVENRPLQFDIALKIFGPTINSGCGVKSESEAKLLKHFLDIVFPSQFPFYHALESNGGRDWLLPFILGTKPLYLAAISMAAYHQHLGPEVPRVERLEKMQKYYSVALLDMRQHLEAFKQEERTMSLEGSIEVLACIVFLITLSVFVCGFDQGWQMHLHAASKVLAGLSKSCADSNEARKSFSPVHRKAHHFFTAAISWYDILSCASTGSRPWAPFTCLYGKAAFLDCGSVIGCENSAVVEIYHVAELRVQKDVFSETEVSIRSVHIRRSLDGIMDKHSSQNLDTDVGESSLDRLAACRQSAITYIFASAAILYLNVSIFKLSSGTHQIYESVEQTIAAIKNRGLNDPAILGTLAWPLCLAGCMATGNQRAFFTEFFNNIHNGMVTDIRYEQLIRCYTIIEDCWRLKHQKQSGTYEQTVLNWKDAMESFDKVVLLI